MTQTSPPAKDPLTEPGPWNAVATAYDEEFYSTLPALTEEAIETLGAPPGATVLDVATGPGVIAIKLAPRVARVVAIDFAAAMIERLRSHVSREGLTNVETHVMDGSALSFSDGSFDAAISMFGIFLFSDRPRGLAEMARVVRPGGRALFSSWATVEVNTMIGAALDAIRTAIPDLPRPAGPLPTQNPEICAAELRAAGFDGVASKIVTLPVTHESVETFWRSYERAGAPAVLLKKKLGEERWREASARALSHLRERHGQGPLTLQCAAILTSGTRGGG